MRWGKNMPTHVYRARYRKAARLKASTQQLTTDNATITEKMAEIQEREEELEGTYVFTAGG